MEEKKKGKQFSVTADESSQLGFVVQQKVAAEEVAMYWNSRVGGLQQTIMKRLSINPETHVVDWGQVFSRGTIVVTEKPKPKINPVPVVVKKEDHGTDSPKV